jgi:dTDP-4-amino-4,6-dideoxygalactose transaminase
VKINDFSAEPEELRLATISACERVIRSGWYILGPELQQFEMSWARRSGAKHAIGVANGMDAIEIGIRALGIGPGDEVITTSMTAFATVLAIIRSGATPVLADINPATAILSMESAARCITPRTRAVVLVHLYGQLSDLENWQSFCMQHGLHLIEDCAQSHNAQWQGRPCGTFGVVGAFSFYPTKNLGALGDAGMITTNDSLISERSQRLRNYGQSSRYSHESIGLNSRLDEIQAAILSERINWLDGMTQRRRAIAKRYHEELNTPRVLLMQKPMVATAHSYHLFVVRCAERDALAAHLKLHGIESLIHYPIPIHRQAAAREIRTDPAGLGYAELHAETCLSIPCHPQLDDVAVERVISAIQRF